ncbi:hypothetical protein EJB05_14314, partial [Eragrostis curvula]
MGKRIIKYDLTEGILSAIDLPELYEEPYDIVLTVEDGGLGFACLKDDILYLWSSQSGLNGIAGWAQRRAIELKMLLPDCAMSTTSFRLNGFVESTYSIFVSTDVGVFTIELKSEQVKKVAEGRINGSIIPHTSFCTPVLAGPFKDNSKTKQLQRDFASLRAGHDALCRDKDVLAAELK